MASRMVKVENLMADDLTITLTDGTDIGMEPYFRGSPGHISREVAYDTLPLSVTKKNGMLSRKLVKLIDV
jgi:hypothetical protein